MDPADSHGEPCVLALSAVVRFDSAVRRGYLGIYARVLFACFGDGNIQ